MSDRVMRLIALGFLAVALAGCGRYGEATTAVGTPPPANFPVGTYQKQTDRERLTWTFRPDGIWTEVDESLDGSFTGVAKGRYFVSGGVLEVDPIFPTFLEPSTHDWRVDGHLLWTTFRNGVDEDRDFFEGLDRLAWRPLP